MGRETWSKDKHKLAFSQQVADRWKSKGKFDRKRTNKDRGSVSRNVSRHPRGVNS